MKAVKLQRGTQIKYVPLHATGIESEFCEDGFVTEDRGEIGIFCRYWSKVNIGELRTKANSELTPRQCLVLHKSTSDKKVQEALEKYC